MKWTLLGNNGTNGAPKRSSSSTLDYMYAMCKNQSSGDTRAVLLEKQLVADCPPESTKSCNNASPNPFVAKRSFSLGSEMFSSSSTPSSRRCHNHSQVRSSRPKIKEKHQRSLSLNYSSIISSSLDDDNSKGTNNHHSMGRFTNGCAKNYGGQCNRLPGRPPDSRLTRASSDSAHSYNSRPSRSYSSTNTAASSVIPSFDAEQYKLRNNNEAKRRQQNIALHPPQESSSMAYSASRQRRSFSINNGTPAPSKDCPSFDDDNSKGTNNHSMSGFTNGCAKNGGMYNRLPGPPPDSRLTRASSDSANSYSSRSSRSYSRTNTAVSSFMSSFDAEQYKLRNNNEAKRRQQNIALYPPQVSSSLAYSASRQKRSFSMNNVTQTPSSNLNDLLLCSSNNKSKNKNTLEEALKKEQITSYSDHNGKLEPVNNNFNDDVLGDYDDSSITSEDARTDGNEVLDDHFCSGRRQATFLSAGNIKMFGHCSTIFDCSVDSMDVGEDSNNNENDDDKNGISSLVNDDNEVLIDTHNSSVNDERQCQHYHQQLEDDHYLSKNSQEDVEEKEIVEDGLDRLDRISSSPQPRQHHLELEGMSEGIENNVEMTERHEQEKKHQNYKTCLSSQGQCATENHRDDINNTTYNEERYYTSSAYYRDLVHAIKDMPNAKEVSDAIINKQFHQIQYEMKNRGLVTGLSYKRISGDIVANKLVNAISKEMIAHSKREANRMD